MFLFVSSRIHVCVSHLFFLPPVSVAFSLYPLTHFMINKREKIAKIIKNLKKLSF